MCSDYSTDQPSLSLSSDLFYSPKHSSIEIRPVNNPTVASKWSDKWKSLTTLTLSPKLGMIYFVSDKGQNRPKARPFVPNSQVGQVKENFLKEIKSATPGSTQIIKYISSLLLWRKF